MAKSIRIIVSVLLIMFLIAHSVFVFAEISIRKTTKAPGKGIEIIIQSDGSLKEMSYITSATGATGGIRYKFTAITIEFEGLNIVIPTKNITGGANPPAGVQEFYEILISREGIIEQYKQQVGGRELTKVEIEKFNKAFSNPQTINLGAYIEIYNSDTGKTLEEITSVEEIYSKAAKYGFPKRNLEDMESRFSNKDRPSSDFDFEVDEVPKTGLRPSVIVE